MRPKNNKSNRGRISNVRVVDPNADQDSVRVDRMISAAHTAEGQIRVLVNSVVGVAATGAEQDISFSMPTFYSSDEFPSFAGQYLEWRIRAAKFEVYNTNSQANNPVIASTFHGRQLGNGPWGFSYTQVADSEDAAIIPANGQRTSFYWIAKTPNELAFQSTSSAVTAVYDNGGLRVAIPAYTGAGVANIMVVVKFVIDFRGRY